MKKKTKKTVAEKKVVKPVTKSEFYFEWADGAEVPGAVVIGCHASGAEHEITLRLDDGGIEILMEALNKSLEAMEQAETE